MQCIPKAAGISQREAMRDAFYAGALSLFQSMHESVSHELEVTESDLEIMNAIEEDLADYPARRLTEAP